MLLRRFRENLRECCQAGQRQRIRDENPVPNACSLFDITPSDPGAGPAVFGSNTIASGIQLMVGKNVVIRSLYISWETDFCNRDLSDPFVVYIGDNSVLNNMLLYLATDVKVVNIGRNCILEHSVLYLKNLDIGDGSIISDCKNNSNSSIRTGESSVLRCFHIASGSIQAGNCFTMVPYKELVEKQAFVSYDRGRDTQSCGDVVAGDNVLIASSFLTGSHVRIGNDASIGCERYARRLNFLGTRRFEIGDRARICCSDISDTHQVREAKIGNDAVVAFTGTRASESVLSVPPRVSVEI